MKYVFEQFKNTKFIRLQSGNDEIIVMNGEAVCTTNKQVAIALTNGGAPAVTKKSKGSKS